MASGGYVDNIKVKIAEKCKPPPRISLPSTYSQRLNQNKQILDALPRYEFVLEKTVVEKMREWRSARAAMAAGLAGSVDAARQRLAEQRRSPEQSDESEPSPSGAYKHQILLPTQAASNFGRAQTNFDKSPINISDFEADTSSPFDNMELESINDMKELAEVLKLEGMQPAGSDYSFQGASGYYQGYANPVTSTHYTNGYYYPPETIQAKSSFAGGGGHFSQFQFNDSNRVGYENNRFATGTTNRVPNIIQSLEHELDNTHLDHGRRMADVKKAAVSAKKSDECSELNSLPKNLQEMSRKISLMGFPLARVAKVCQALGDDQKQVVDHLLAMSELLDLGFSESRVSLALLECDNDRDKALDLLIS